MSAENQMPDWVQALFEALASTIEFKGMAYMEGYYSAPDETAWGVDLLEMAPALMEIAEAGPNDGEEVYGIIHNFDLLAAQELFDEVNGLIFGLENDGLPCITIEGTTGGREIVVLIYVLPFEDAEVNAIIEVE
jgi:hypothetical protein